MFTEFKYIAENCILTSTYLFYMCSKWYTSDLHVVTSDIYAFVPTMTLNPGKQEVQLSGARK
jgi:hypothetical protein